LANNHTGFDNQDKLHKKTTKTRTIRKRTRPDLVVKKKHAKTMRSGFPLYFGIQIQELFKDPEDAFSRTNSQQKFTA